MRQENRKLSHPVKEGNSIEGIFVTQNNEKFLMISYGKFYNVENEDKSVNEKEISLNEIPANEAYSINENEFLLKLKLQ